MKRAACVDALVRRIGDINPGTHDCLRKFGLCCPACEMVDELCDALIAFERDEFLGLGADLVDVEPIAP